MVLYNLADTYFVGMLGDPIQTAAVTLAAPLLLMFNAVNNLFGVGSSSMMSRAMGQKDFETVARSSSFGLYCAALCGMLFSLGYMTFEQPVLLTLGATAENAAHTAAYLGWTVACGATPAIVSVVISNLFRAEGSSLHASIGAMSGCLLNILLDPIFILPWGLNLGAAGAGLATFISNCAACVYYFVLLVVKRGKTYVCVRPKMALPKKPVVLGIFAVGVPASIQNLLNVTGMTILNNFTAGYGSAAVAAMGIAHKTSMIPMYISMGLSQGIMPLIGYNYASGNVPRMKKTLTFSAKLSLSFMAVTTLGYCLFAQPLVRVFMDNDLIVRYGAVFMRAQSLAQPFLCMDFLAVGVFQACGMGGKALLFAFLRKVALEIPALFLLNRLFPMYGLAYAQLVAEFILAIAAVVVLARLFKRLEGDGGGSAPCTPG